MNKNVDDTVPWLACPNCKRTDAPIFMVHDKLWETSGFEGHPCIPCFELAIGRRLKVEDLKSSPLCNHMLDMGWFLGNRPFGTQLILNPKLDMLRDFLKNRDDFITKKI